MTLDPPRVLIVEDDPDLLVVLRVNLVSAGIEPILAGDGRTAIARIEAETTRRRAARRDAARDRRLAGARGAARARQPRPRGRVLGEEEPRTTWSAREELGAVAYLVKPFDIDRLVDAVVSSRRP